MKQVTAHAAETHLARLLREVAAGQEVVITSSGQPVAKLVSIDEGRPSLGVDKGRFVVPDDFDAPLDEELLRPFEAGAKATSFVEPTPMSPEDRDRIKRLLKSVGKRCYRNCYSTAVRLGDTFKVEHLLECDPDLEGTSIKAQRTRCSKIRRLVREGWADEALDYCR